MDPRVFVKTSDYSRPASISDATIQMDHNAVVLFTIDPLARSPRTTARRRSTGKAPDRCCEINSRFRRFGPRTVHPAPLGRALAPTRRSVCSGGSAISGPHDLVDTGLIPEPATSSARTITMDHDAIICFMTDRLTRAPDADVHVPSVGSPKYPSRRVDVIYL